MPTLTENIIKDGSQGLITNASAVDSDKSSFRVLKNVRVDKFGILRNINGSGTAQVYVNGTLTDIPALPSGFALETAYVYHKAVPSDSDVVIIFGNKSSRDRFYVWPDIEAGAWVTSGGGSFVSNSSINWLELTEAEITTIATVNSDTSYTLTSLSNGSTSNYYSDWWIYNPDVSGPYYDYVTASYAGSVTNQITIKWGNPLRSVGDTILLFRFPVFDEASVGASSVDPFYTVDSLPTFHQHGEDLAIKTGTHDMNTGPDLWLGFIGNGSSGRNMFNDASADFTYNGWYFDASHPYPVAPANVITAALTTTGASTDPFPWTSGTEYYALFFTLVYDDYQESRIYYDKNTASQTTNAYGSITAGTQHFSGNLVIDPREDLIRLSDYSSVSTIPTVWSRRITKVRAYLANGELFASTRVRPTSDYFFVKEFDINDSFSHSSGVYTLAYTITGSDWIAAQAYPFTDVAGHETSKVGANATFEAQASSRVFIAPVYDDTEKLWRVLFTPIRASGQIPHSYFPASLVIDTLQYGISEIKGLAEQFGRLLVFGTNTFLVADVAGENQGQVVEQFQRIGTTSYRTIKNIDGQIFFSSLDSPLEVFDGNRIAVPSPGYAIKDLWDALTQAEKQAAFSGYCKKLKSYVIRFGTRNFVFDTRLNVWYEYVSSSTYIDFIEGVDEQLYGLTSSGIVELFAATPTESLSSTIESQIYDGKDQHYRRLRMDYKSGVLIQVIGIDDNLPSTIRERFKHIAPPISQIDKIDRSISFKTSRAAIKITSSSSTSPNIEIESLGLGVTEKREK